MAQANTNNGESGPAWSDSIKGPDLSFLTGIDFVGLLPFGIAFLIVLLILQTFLGEKFLYGFLGLLLLSMIVVNSNKISATINTIGKGVLP